MLEGVTLNTSRLVLRKWKPTDSDAFAAMNADARVMEFFPKTLDHAESDAIVDRIKQHFEEHGFGLWAVEVPSVSPFIGFIGLSISRFESHFTPCVEIGWRLAHEFWGQGYATEGAFAALEHGFRSLELSEIVSLTAVINHRSRRVMERIGMTHSIDDDFDHPNLEAGDRLRRHVLYRLSQEGWNSRVKVDDGQ